MFKSIRLWWKKFKAESDRDWRHVPAPEWAAKRGWRDYW